MCCVQDAVLLDWGHHIFVELLPRIWNDWSANAPSRSAHVQTCFCMSCTTLVKNSSKIIEKIKKKKCRRRYRGKKILPFSKSLQCFFMLWPCQALTCLLSIYPQALPGKVNTPPPLPVSHTYSTYIPRACFVAYYDLLWPTFCLCCAICLNTCNPLSQLYFYLAPSWLHSHTYLHSVSLSTYPSPHTGNWCKYLGGPPVSSTAAVSCGLKQDEAQLSIQNLLDLYGHMDSGNHRLSHIQSIVISLFQIECVRWINTKMLWVQTYLRFQSAWS